MQGIDYFAGVNQGTKNLMDAFSSVEASRRADVQERRQLEADILNNELKSQQIQTGREALAESLKSRRAGEATMTAMAPGLKAGPPLESIPVVAEGSDQATLQPQAGPVQQVPLTIDDRIQRGGEAALSSGVPGAMAQASTAGDLLKKMNPDVAMRTRTSLRKAAMAAMVGGDAAGMASLKEDALAAGTDPNQTASVTFKDNLLQVKNVNGAILYYDPFGDKLVAHNLPVARPAATRAKTEGEWTAEAMEPGPVGDNARKYLKQVSDQKKEERLKSPEEIKQETDKIMLAEELRDENETARIQRKAVADQKIAEDKAIKENNEYIAVQRKLVAALPKLKGVTKERRAELAAEYEEKIKGYVAEIDKIHNSRKGKGGAPAPPVGFKLDPQGRKIGGKPAYISADGKKVWTE